MSQELIERLKSDARFIERNRTRSPDQAIAKDILGAIEAIASQDKRIAELERERDTAWRANERDRTIIIDARNAIHDAIARRSWLLEGRGSYEWDDDRYQKEFAAAIEEIGKPLAILEKLGADWTHCPTDTDAVTDARIDWKARAEAAESALSLAESRGRQIGREEAAKVADAAFAQWAAGTPPRLPQAALGASDVAAAIRNLPTNGPTIAENATVLEPDHG